MTDETHPPARTRNRALGPAPPVPSSPALPASSGAFWGSRTTILRKDADFVEAHAHYLKARTKQTAAMMELVDARIELATVLSRLARLDQYFAHDARMFTLRAETKEALAEAELEQARARLRPATAAPGNPDALADTIDEIVTQMPDVPEEARNTLRQLIIGAVREKKL